MTDQPTDCIVLRYGLDELRIDKRVFASILWNSIPEAAKDPSSEEAVQNVMPRMMVDGFLMVAGPKLLQSIFGKNPPRPPQGADRIRWYLQLFTGLIPELATSRDWGLDVEHAEENERGGITYTVRGFTAQPAQLAEGEAAPGGTGEGEQPADSTYELTSVTGR